MCIFLSTLREMVVYRYLRDPRILLHSTASLRSWVTDGAPQNVYICMHKYNCYLAIFYSYSYFITINSSQPYIWIHSTASLRSWMTDGAPQNVYICMYKYNWYLAIFYSYSYFNTINSSQQYILNIDDKL